MLTDLFNWWKEQMRDLVPASLRPSSGRTWRRTLVIVPDTPDLSSVELFLQSRGGETSLGRHGLNSAGLRGVLGRLPRALRTSSVLRVSPDLLLEREITLPLAAEHDLKRVVSYEMDRLTPFRADEVFWNCLAGKRDPVRNRLHVRVTVIPYLRVEAILTALMQSGLAPARIAAGETTEPNRIIPLTEDRTAHRWLGPRVHAVALGGCGVMVAVAITLPFILQSVAAARLDARIEAVKPQVVEAEKLRKKIATGATTADAIAAARNQLGTPLQIHRSADRPAAGRYLSDRAERAPAEAHHQRTIRRGCPTDRSDGCESADPQPCIHRTGHSRRDQWRRDVLDPRRAGVVT